MSCPNGSWLQCNAEGLKYVSQFKDAYGGKIELPQGVSGEKTGGRKHHRELWKDNLFEQNDDVLAKRCIRKVGLMRKKVMYFIQDIT